MQLIVTGMKCFKGEVEGKSYDSTKLFAQLPVDDSNGNAVGFAQVDFQFGDSSKFNEYKALPFPMLCEVILTQKVRAGKPVTVVEGLKPLGKINQVTGELAKGQ